MAGRVHQLIQELYEVRGRGQSTLHFVRAHLVLSGIDPDAFDEYSKDDESKIALLEQMLQSFGQIRAESRGRRVK